MFIVIHILALKDEKFCEFLCFMLLYFFQSLVITLRIKANSAHDCQTVKRKMVTSPYFSAC